MEKAILYSKNSNFIVALLILSLLFINKANAQVTITKPILTISTCSFPSTYSSLNNIIITEGPKGDFLSGNGQTIILDNPANFEFDTSVTPTGTTQNGSEISIQSIAISTTQITITYSCSGTNKTDTLTISGIRIRATSSASSGNITRTAGSGTVNGLVNTTILASLTSTLLTAAAQPSTITGSAIPCSGTSQTYSVTNIAGTTYSWSFPAGWTQTAGGTTHSVTVTTNENSGTITVTPSNTCGNGTAQSLTVNPVAPSTITSTTPRSVNGSGTVTLDATASSGTISWFAAAIGGSALASGTSYTTPSISVTTTYYVETNNGSCSSAPRTPIVATVNKPEINIQGKTVSIPDGNTVCSFTNATDFGETYTGNIFSQTFTIQNTGIAPLTLGAISFSGANAADFSITTPPSSTVAAGSSTIFVITFRPLTIGIKTAMISIVNDDSNENPYNFNIQGTGIDLGAAQEIEIQGNLTVIPDNDISPSSTDWTILGDSFVGSSIARTYTINNTGTTALTIGAISFSGTNSSEFTITTAPSSSVSGGSSTTFVVNFLPTAVGARNATLSIVNNDASENPYNFSIQGNGIAAAPGVPEIDVQGNTISIVNGDNTPSLNDLTEFGTNQIITNTITKTFTIRNYGGSNLNLTGGTLVSISGSSDFTLISSPTTPITSLGSTSFSIQFNPSSLGIKTALITIVNNDSDENPYTFSIKGEGIQTFFDSDGDGVFDNIDIDDDNDGIKDGTEEINCNNSNGTKVDYKFLYETFGTGTRTTISTTYEATTSYSYQDPTTPTDVEGSGLTLDLNDGKYTVGSETQTIASWAPQYWYKGVDHTGNVNGRMAIFNASYTPSIFYTALISGALPNTPITYSFWVLNLDRTDAPNIGTRLRPDVKVEFRDINDNVLQSISTGDIAPTTNGNLAGDWQQFTANLTFSVSTFKVIFINNETGGLGNDLALDDILITQKLCDLDADGIADMFDLDVDNDGIEDVIEAGLGNMSNGKGKIDIAWADANVNGLHDSAESVAAIQALDSDGDGIPNYMDLDSDNDSLFDVDESGAGNTNAPTGYVNGDGDITGDGKGDGPESETFRNKDTNGDQITEGFGDGILDIYDYGTGVLFSSQYGNFEQGFENANPATTYLKDTDGDGIPDYLDVMSNGSTFDIANTLLLYDYKTLDTNNDGIIDGTADVDKDGILDTFDTAFSPAYFGSPRDMHTKLLLDFDGRNDYGQSKAILGGLSNATLMAWIDLNPDFSSDGVIIGQDKFQIKITSTKKLEAVVNNTTVTFNTALNVSQWYNVAAVYGGGFLKLYLNGVLMETQAKTGSIESDASLFTIGKNPLSDTKYFKGKIDEIRVFNSALTDLQLQRMVYQEIQDSGSQIRGISIPKNIATSPASLPFANLLHYFRMDTYKDDIIDDLTTPSTDVTGTKIYNHKNIYVQQAPMPFITERTGDFATAVNSPINDVRGLDIMDNNYSIIKVKHAITEPSNTVGLGMIVDPGIEIIINNDNKLQNDWYLKLDGKIDLVGKSQLVQTSESDLDVSSAGSIERDQQGQSNLYNYNYWSSPVSPINITSNNTDYTIDGVMKDGTNPSAPANINWVSGYNGAPTSPISLAKYWLYKFDNYGNDYFNWARITQTTPLRVGLAYTLKGSGASGAQNYVFIGKPNNGLITSNHVGENQLLLTGNPYPSALDANEFINDNLSSIDGSLYFWEHYSTNTTHILRDYQGGYAVRNLTGGIPPTSAGVDYISHLGTPSKGAPNQFIPVGQGFFVTGKSGAGGTVIFNNGQRGFHKEDEAGISNIMYKTTDANAKKPKSTSLISNSNNDPVKVNTYKKIRLGYNSNANYHRQSLLGFMNENASKELDYGYDGLNIDNFANDMYFLCGKNKLAIQGVGYFKKEDTFPIGVKTNIAGKVTFSIDELENFEKKQKVYIYDKESKIYHNIKGQVFEIVLPVGQFDNRFLLCFKDKNRSENHEDNYDDSNDKILAKYSQTNGVLEITNTLPESTISTVSLFNILGQFITKWETSNLDQKNIEIPILDISSGIYITKITTTNGDFSTKIVVP